MRLGIFGGTFDPVHYGHLLLAEQCREQCRLDEVWFLPAGTPPHKTGRPISPGSARAEMLELAVAGHDRFKVDRRELRKPVPSFTVETLAELHAEVPDRELFFLMGADSLRDFPAWREPGRILELARLVAVNRADEPVADLRALSAALGDDSALRVQLVSIPRVDLSSSDMRRRVAEGRSLRYMTPRAVECYLETHALYR